MNAATEAADPAPGGGHWTCGQWAAALADYFFPAELAGQPALLCLDDEAAAAIRGTDPAAAVADLASAVRSWLSPDDTDPLSRFYRSLAPWRTSGAALVPPFLPLLALSVLAASRMATSEGIAPHNYYRRLREVLGLPQTGARVPGYDETMSYLWAGLVYWLDTVNGGRRGLSAIDTDPPPHIRHIGAALSQAELRQSDRQKLGGFFRYLRLAPGDSVEGDELLNYFRAWAATAHLSAGARRAAQDPEAAIRLKRILTADLATWDGRERDRSGRTVVGLAVTLSLRHPPSLGLAAERPPSSASTPEVLRARLPTGQEVELRPLTDRWFEPLDISPGDAGLRLGLQMNTERVAFVLGGASCFVFTEDEELDCLVSVRSAPVLRPCAALVEAAYRSETLRLLASAEPGWREIAVRGALPAGWALFAGIEMGALPAAPVPPALAALVPSAGTRVSLENGLRLPRGTDAYLTGGEPDVWMPGEEPHAVEVDGIAVLPDTAGRARLSLVGLAEGAHTVRIGPASRTFRSLRSTGLTRPSPEHRLAMRLTMDRARSAVGGYVSAEPRSLPPRGEVWVEGLVASGAPEDLPSPPRTPLRLRIGPSEYILAGAHPGEVVRIPTLPAPEWARRAGLIWNFDEAAPAFEPVWIFARWPDRWRVKLTAGVHPAAPMTGGSELLAAWRGAFTLGCFPDDGDAAAAELWDLYLDAADVL